MKLGRQMCSWHQHARRVRGGCGCGTSEYSRLSVTVGWCVGGGLVGGHCRTYTAVASRRYVIPWQIASGWYYASVL